MNLLNVITAAGLLILLICTVLLIRYSIIWHSDINNTQIRLEQIEKELREHPQLCPMKQQMDNMMRFNPVPSDKNAPNSIEKIRQHIQIYHPQFINALTIRTSEKLTYTDELLCMMIKLQYSNKEIASILSITTNSVITARYRLKKKLSITSNQQIDEWIQEIETV